MVRGSPRSNLQTKNIHSNTTDSTHNDCYLFLNSPATFLVVARVIQKICINISRNY